MHRTIFAAALAVGMMGSVHAASLTGTVADPIKPKPPFFLTDGQRRLLVEAVSREDTLEKAPADFQSEIGAKVPVQAKLAAHPLPRPLVYDVPLLKQYYYARLPDRVLIIDPMSGTIADIVTQ